MHCNFWYDQRTKLFNYFKDSSRYVNIIDMVSFTTFSAKEKHQNEGPTSATVSELSINMDKITFTQHSRTVLVHDRVGSARRRPNQEELEKIINHLHRANQQQESEVCSRLHTNIL